MTWRVLLEDIELMPQDQDFGFHAQHPDEEKGNCDHQPQSCSDSVIAVTSHGSSFRKRHGLL